MDHYDDPMHLGPWLGQLLFLLAILVQIQTGLHAIHSQHIAAKITRIIISYMTPAGHLPWRWNYQIFAVQCLPTHHLIDVRRSGRPASV